MIQSLFSSKKGNKSNLALSTASLPDIVFMLLFFFMVTTTLKKESPPVNSRLPKARQAIKIDKNYVIGEVYAGNDKKGEIWRTKIFTNGKEFLPTGLTELLVQKLSEIPATEQKKMTVTLKLDEKTPMYLVKEITSALQNAGIAKVNYFALVPGSSPQTE